MLAVSASALRAGDARNDRRPRARRAGRRDARRQRHRHERRHERVDDADDEFDGLLPGAAAAARQLSRDRRTAGLQDIGSQRRHPVGRAAGHGRPDAWRRRRQRNGHRQRRSADSRDRRPHDRTEPRPAQRREPSDVLEHASPADAIRDRRQLVGRRAVCGAGLRQPDLERHVRARRRRRKRMDDRRRDQQRQRPPPRVVSELRHDRGGPNRDGQLRCVLRTRHRPWHFDDDPQRHQRDARVAELPVLEQPVERAEVFREDGTTTPTSRRRARTATTRSPIRWRRRTSTPTGNRTTSRPPSAARSSATSSSPS